MRTTLISCVFGLLLTACLYAQTSEFTYQGRLTDGVIPATGTYQMQFSLFGSAAGSDQIGSTITVSSVTVVQGVFTVTLNIDAPDAFDGGPRWLAIAVKRSADPDYTPLNPRQPLTSAPYSVKSQSASLSDGLSVACIQCVTDSQIQSVDGVKVTGTVANATTAQNVSGVVPIENGGTGSSTKNFIDLSTNQIILGNKTFNQTASFTGANITSLTSSSSATFNGSVAFNNADPISVSGTMNVGGSVNAEQLSASELSLAGNLSLLTGTADIQMGAVSNAEGIEIKSSAAGHSPGLFLTHTGAQGRKFRIASFGDNTNAGSFVIRDESTCQGFVGVDRVSLDGWGRLVSRFGDPCGSSILEPSGGITFSRLPSFTGTHFSGISIEALGGLNAGDAGGMINFGINTGREGSFNTAYNGYWLRADSRLGSQGFHFFKKAAASGTETELMTVNDAGTIVHGPLNVFGPLTLDQLPVAASNTLCRDGSFRISLCGSSIRYKTNVNPLGSGLALIRQLRPVTYDWKADNMPDLGLIAEEVAEVEPLLITRNRKGQIEGVKYDRIGVVLINVVREQQAADRPAPKGN